MYTFRKGHLAKFYFDKLHHINFANKKNVWVPYKANPQGPKRKWVPKSPSFVFDVGAGLTKRERDGALMVDAHGHDGLIFGCIAIKEFWWDYHHVWSFGV